LEETFSEANEPDKKQSKMKKARKKATKTGERDRTKSLEVRFAMAKKKKSATGNQKTAQSSEAKEVSLSDQSKEHYYNQMQQKYHTWTQKHAETLALVQSLQTAMTSYQQVMSEQNVSSMVITEKSEENVFTFGNAGNQTMDPFLVEELFFKLQASLRDFNSILDNLYDLYAKARASAAEVEVGTWTFLLLLSI
jgi:hypothetical protein